VGSRAGLDGCGISRHPPGFDPRTVKGRKANCIGHISSRNCLLKHVVEVVIRRKDRSDWKTKRKT
jgi:hypothetical protein